MNPKFKDVGVAFKRTNLGYYWIIELAGGENQMQGCEGVDGNVNEIKFISLQKAKSVKLFLMDN